MNTGDASGGTGGGGAPGPGGGGGVGGSNVVVSSGGVTGVAAKITHVKTTTIDGSGASVVGGVSGLGIGTIMTSGGVSGGGIKVSATNTVNNTIALNTSQAGTAFRAIGAGGQSTQLRVMMPSGTIMPPGTIMPQSMIKQLEGAAAAAAAASAGRTQITAIPASGARTVSNTSITVTRPVTQTTYLPRATTGVGGVNAAQMSGGTVGNATIGGTQRLVTPIRTTTGGVVGGTATGGGATTVTGLTAAGSFVRSTSVSRQSSSPASTVISPATSTTWMASNTGQVQLIRAIPQTQRQRLITTHGISSVAGGTATSGTVVATTATLAQAAASQQQQQALVNQANIQAVVSSQQSQQQTYVATLATVLPPRQQTATLVYSSNNVTGGAQQSPQSQQTQPHQFNSTVTGQRFAVATPLNAGAGNGSAPRQIRPISLPKSFSATKLNTTSISIRSPNLPQLTPTLGTNVSAANSPRSTTVGGTAGNVIPTTNLSTTRIIQLQQQPGGGTQQLIGPTGRLTNNVMLQPIIVNATAGGKIGIRPPVSMATKVQPSLTITQLGIGKLPGAAAAAASLQQQQQNLQSLNNVNNNNNASAASPTLSSNNLTSVTGGTTTTQLLNVTQGANGQLLATQNVAVSGAGTTVVPLAITTRGGAGGNILTGTITPIKNGITVGKVMSQAQLSGGGGNQNEQSSNSNSVFIHQSAAQRIGGNINTAAANSNNNNSGNATSAFLPPGSTYYYESVNASSVQVSTGVLSLTTTTVTSSTMSQQQMTTAAGNNANNLNNMSNNANNNNNLSNNLSSNLAITSLPYSAHAPSSTATFTVVPSSSVRTIGQLQLPVSGSAQLHAVPVRFSADGAGGAHIALAAAAPSSSQAVTATTQIVASAGQQLLLPAPQTTQQPQHMVIPLQTSIKLTSGIATSGIGGVGATSSAVVSNFLRKREASDGSPVRAAKNLAPTFLSMNSNVVGAAISPAQISTASSSSSSSSASACNAFNAANAAVAAVNNAANVAALNVAEALSKKVGGGGSGVTMASTRSSRAVSPASSDGSTTVSANSSPGIEQQIQDNNMVINRMAAGSNDSTHFNPINDLYSNHHAAAANQQHNLPSTPASSRNSLDHQPHASAAHQQLLNGGVIDCPPRKKSRRSTNDSQHSTQSQASLSLPPPTGNANNMTHGSGGSSTSGGSTVLASSGNGTVMLPAPGHELNNITSAATVAAAAQHKSNNINQITTAAAEYKENTKPTEYVLRKPRNCTLLHTYKQNWKAANNHFQRYTDIKPREERRPTVIDLANQANVLGKINGWKIYHLRSQMEDLCENESLGLDKLSVMLKQMETHGDNPEIHRISELLKGNMQRSKIIVDGVNEAQNQIMKIFEHKSHISDIIHRCASKRNFKKREKV